MALNQLLQFEVMSDIQRIQAIESILMANGAKRIEKTSRENSYTCTVIFISSHDHLEYTMDLIYNQIYNIDIFH